MFLEHDQWLEFDLGHPSTVTSLITKGRGDTNQDQWVTKYKVSFSNDTRLWLYYKDKSQIEPKVRLFCSRMISERTFHHRNFPQIMIADSERIHFLNEPFFARYVRLHPTEWHNHVSMRAAILGCPHQGNRSCFHQKILSNLNHLGACFPGYFRVNSEAQCGKSLFLIII